MNKNFTSGVLVAFLLTILPQFVSAQVSFYDFINSSEVYTELSTGTVVATATALTGAAAMDDVVYPVANGTITFPFKFDNITYTGLWISSNGFITFGSAPSGNGASTGYTPISATTNYPGAVSAFGRNLIGVYDNSVNQIFGEIRYAITGVSPNRKFVVQFKNFRPANSAGRLSFQIRLCENGNAIEVVYGSFTGITPASTAQVGIRGAYVAGSMTNTLNRKIAAATNTWATSSTGTLQTDACEYSSTFVPASGQIFKYQPSLCPTAQSLSATNITQTSAQLTWVTPISPGTFTVEYGLQGFTPGTGTVVSNISGNSVTINGLTATTAYQYYVKQFCGANGNSNTAGPQNFSTGGIGEDCASAPLVPVANDSVSCIGTQITSGVSQNGPNAQCSDAMGNVANDDVWVKFVAPTTSNTIVFKTTAGTVNDWVLEVWRGCPGSGGAVLLCADDYTATGKMPFAVLCQNQYIAGETLYVRMWTYAQNLTGNMTLCIYKGTECAIPPSNDECNTNILIPISSPQSCPGSGYVYTTKYATRSDSSMSCKGTGSINDVWFRFNTASYGDMQITFTRMTASNLKAQVIFACGEFEVACWNPADGPHLLTGLNPMADYILRVWSDSLGWGTFNVCIQDICANPTAAMSGVQNICKGDSIFIPVNFTGAPPWTFTYSNGTSNTIISTSSTPYYISVVPQVNTTYSPISISDISCSGVVSGNTVVNVTNKSTITSISPTIGPVGTAVTIKGTNLSSVLQVRFNGMLAPGFSIVNDSTINVNVPSGATTGPVSVSNVNCTFQGAIYTVGVSNITLTIHALLEGLYSSNGAMHSNAFLGGTAADSITLKLAAATAPYGVVATKTAVLSSAGYATFQFTSTGLLNNSYYLIIKNRNSIETWSKTPLLLNSTSKSYDFTH